jgi:capsular exopolysaccharide synthesis family protein
MAAVAQVNGALPRPEAARGRLEVRDIARVIQKRRWLVLLVLFIVTLAGGLIGATAPRHYAATAVVLVHLTSPGFPWLEEPKQQPPEQEQVAIKTQARLVATLDNAQKTVEELAKKEGPDRVAVSIGDVLDAVKVEVEGADILRVIASSGHREWVVPLANTMAEVYVNAARERSRGTSGEAQKFLAQQIDETQAKIDKLAAQRLAILKAMGVADPTQEVTSTGQLIAQLKTDREKTQEQLDAVRRSLPVLERQAGQEQKVERLPMMQPNPARDAAQKLLDERTRILADLRARYTEEHPFVKEAQESVQLLQQQLTSTPAEIPHNSYRPNPNYDLALGRLQTAQAQVEALTAQLAAIHRSLRDITAQAQKLPPRLSDLQRLDEQLTAARQALQNLLQMQQTQKLREASRTSAAELVDRAGAPKALQAPLIRTLVFSILLGLFCGIALAMLLEALDNTIRSPDEVARQTGLPLLGAIPLLEDTAPQVIALTAPQSPASEAYRTLRSSIYFTLTDLPARSFVVTSSIGGEGRSSVAANLAVVMAHVGHSVILADTDLRRPTQAHLFGCDPGRGLTNVLVGEAVLEDTLQDTGVPGLQLLATGPLPPNPAELLDSARMTELIGELTQRADVVIFDSPPSLLLSDGVILSSKVDRTILIAESGTVTIEAFREVTRLIEHARGSLLGVVVNKYRSPAGRYYQTYFAEETPEASVSLPVEREETPPHDTETTG